MDRLEVARFTTLPEAELAAALLKRHGVDARVPDRDAATNMAHMQVAFGGLRVTAPDFQIVQARDLIARARRGELGDLAGEESEEWRLDATPGMVGELHEDEIHGAIGSMKTVIRYVAIGILGLCGIGLLLQLMFY